MGGRKTRKEICEETGLAGRVRKIWINRQREKKTERKWRQKENEGDRGRMKETVSEK